MCETCTLRKWTPREKYVKYQNFPTLFGVLLSLECFDKFHENPSNLQTL